MAKTRRQNVDPVRGAVANLGVAARTGGDVAEARRTLKEAKLERWIQEALETAPPLTEQQRSRLATMLAPRGAK